MFLLLRRMAGLGRVEPGRADLQDVLAVGALHPKLSSPTISHAKTWRGLALNACVDGLSAIMNDISNGRALNHGAECMSR